VGQLSLGSELEEVFHISLEVDEMMALKNVRDVVRVIQTKLAAQT
jgi:acyl carrier protein